MSIGISYLCLQIVAAVCMLPTHTHIFPNPYTIKLFRCRYFLFARFIGNWFFYLKKSVLFWLHWIGNLFWMRRPNAERKLIVLLFHYAHLHGFVGYWPLCRCHMRAMLHGQPLSVIDRAVWIHPIQWMKRESLHTRCPPLPLQLCLQLLTAFPVYSSHFNYCLLDVRGPPTDTRICYQMHFNLLRNRIDCAHSIQSPVYLLRSHPFICANLQPNLVLIRSVFDRNRTRKKWWWKFFNILFNEEQEEEEEEKTYQLNYMPVLMMCNPFSLVFFFLPGKKI